jgi:HK97 family phage prohead protease
LIKFVTEKEFREAVKNGTAEGLAIRKSFVTSTKAGEGENAPIIFATSTATEDRMGDTIAVDGWDLKNYRANPVVLWAHDRSELPVAKSLREWTERGALMSEAQFTPKDLYPFGAMVGEMYRQGFLSAVSVGFQPQTYVVNEERAGQYGVAYDFLTQELLEYSAVPIPANPEALISARAAGIDTAPMREWAEKILDGEGVIVLPRSLVERAWKASKAPSTVTIGDKTFPVETTIAKDGDQGDAPSPMDEALAKLQAHCAELGSHVATLGKHVDALETAPKAAPVAEVKAAPLVLTSSADVAEIVRRTAADEISKQQRRKTTGRLD